jgi:UDP-glucose:(heptosyl)LPS alpha-1,3-glucosyltransferase
MKFATAILAFSKQKGGAERYLVDLCHRMAEEGHEVHVYAENWDRESSRLYCHRVKTIPFPKSLRLLSFAIKASKAMERGGYDVTLGVGTTLKAGVIQPHGGVHWAWFWRSLKAYDNPVLRMIKLLGRVLSPKQWAAGWIESRPYKRGNYSRIVAISDMVKKDMIRWYGITEDKITVVYNGVDLDRFHPRNRQYREDIRKRHGIGREWVILFVSNNFRMKGLRFLMKALAKRKGEGCSVFKLLILGRDRQAPYLQLAKRLGLSGEVIFAGSTDEPERYYGAADLLVHPTFYDACSLTVLEAMASGLPVITTVCNGAGGVMTTGQEGAVLPNPGDVQDLAKKISDILKPGAVERASIAARRVSEFHSLERNWREMKNIFQNHGQEGAGKG